MGENGPMPGVYVYLNNLNNYSDENGRVSFTNLDAREEYTYEVHNYGYEDVSETFYLEANTIIAIPLKALENKGGSLTKDSQISTSSNEFSMQDFKVYPIPAKDEITVETDGKELCSVKLLTQSGTVVYQSIIKGNKHRINMSNLSNGVYFVTVKTDNSYRTQRIMKL